MEEPEDCLVALLWLAFLAFDVFIIVTIIHFTLKYW